ncbi:MAG TPA: ATP synthase F1 subunit delta [Actinomycetota bacterium]|nr:ATP synthase F1 subunit delta [Actinomycetota bacterium]
MRPGAPVARRYAKALYSLAVEARQADLVAEELARFEGLVAGEPALRDVLRRPWVKAAAKRAMVLEVATRLGVSPLTRRFLALVAQRRRFELLGDILAAYRARLDEAAGRIRAHVRSAAPLDEATRASLRDRLGRRIGKMVLLDTEVDPRLLGGFVAEVGGRVLDLSVAGQLGALRERITRGAGGTA